MCIINSKVPKQRKLNVLDKGYVLHVNHMGSDLTPLQAARLSTGNKTGVDVKKDDNTRDYLWRSKHATPFEMNELILELKTLLLCRSQIQRHRTFSYNEFSGRYSVMPDEMYVPLLDRVKSKSETKKQSSGEPLDSYARWRFLGLVKKHNRNSRAMYREALGLGVAEELARVTIPQNQYTKFWMKGNLRNWLAFCDLRLRSDVQPETRELATAAAWMIQQLWPKAWAVWEEHTFFARTFSESENYVLRQMVDALTALTGGPAEFTDGTKQTFGNYAKLRGWVDFDVDRAVRIFEEKFTDARFDGRANLDALRVQRGRLVPAADSTNFILG